MEERDPAKCGALESSLWELEALRNHYDPTVARLAKIFEQPIKQQQFDLEQFLSHSYASVRGVIHRDDSCVWRRGFVLMCRDCCRSLPSKSSANPRMARHWHTTHRHRCSRPRETNTNAQIFQYTFSQLTQLTQRPMRSLAGWNSSAFRAPRTVRSKQLSLARPCRCFIAISPLPHALPLGARCWPFGSGPLERPTRRAYGGLLVGEQLVGRVGGVGPWRLELEEHLCRLCQGYRRP